MTEYVDLYEYLEQLRQELPSNCMICVGSISDEDTAEDDTEIVIAICDWRISDAEFTAILNEWPVIEALMHLADSVFYKRWRLSAGNVENEIIVQRVRWWVRLARWLLRK